MDILICVLIMLAGIVVCLICSWSIFFPIFLGVILLGIVGLRKGHSALDMLKMAWLEAKKMLIVVEILLILGIMSGLWRTSGTIAVVIYHGIQLVQPKSFIIVCFLLSSLVSYMLGSSFGTAGTIGLILITMARAGGTSIPLAAGAIISACNFGDRGSPVSSAASLVATVTDTELYDDIRKMRRTHYLPYLLSLVFYAVASVLHPLQTTSDEILGVLSRNFCLSWWTVIPAVVMLLLPLVKIPVKWSMALSALSSLIISFLVQKVSFLSVIKTAVLGFSPEDAALSNVMAGGGIISMVTSCAIIFSTGLFLGEIKGLGGLDHAEELSGKLCGKTGKFFTTAFISTVCSVLFCNQTLAIAMTTQLVKKNYGDREEEKSELAVDISNSAMLIPALVPWAIACSVPLSMLSVGPSVIPCAVLVYLTPICHALTKRWFLKRAK